MEQLNQILILEIFALKFIKKQFNNNEDKSKKYIFTIWKSLKNFGWVPKKIFMRKLKN